jgi:hypothetical protein
MTARPQFIIVLEAEKHVVDPTRALRAALKRNLALLRFAGGERRRSNVDGGITMSVRRDYRLVAEDGVASAEELHRDYEAALRRRRELHGAAGSTVEALMYEFRTYGLAALAGPNCRCRLSELSNAQVREVIGRLMRIRPNYPAITDELLFRLGELL